MIVSKRPFKGDVGIIHSKPCTDTPIRRPKPRPNPEPPDFIMEGEFKV